MTSKPRFYFGKSQSLIACEQRDALCASSFAQLCNPPQLHNAPVEHCAVEAESRAQGYKTILKTSLFCTFLVDLCHKNPVPKIELPADSRESEKRNSYCCLISCDSSESGIGSCYCRFWVLFRLNCSRLSWVFRILLLSCYEKTIKLQCFQKCFAFTTVSFEKIIFETTVWKLLFCFCTVILCCLGSRRP